MYSYASLPPHEQQQHQQQHQQHQQQQQQHQQQGLHPMSRPSPPQPTWAVPQTQQYYATPRGPAIGSREDQRQFMGRADMMTSQPTSTSGVVYSTTMTAPQSLATTDYFPGVIDTSKLLQ